LHSLHAIGQIAHIKGSLINITFAVLLSVIVR